MVPGNNCGGLTPEGIVLCRNELVDLLRREVTPALGCTEPGAIALASAKALSLIGGEIREIELTVSPSIFKNAKAVGIPCTEQTGVDLAAMLGVLIPDPPLDLTIFSQLTTEIVEQAVRKLSEIPPRIQVREGLPGVHIDVSLRTDKGSSQAIIARQHTNFVYLARNGETLLDEQGGVHLSGGSGLSLMEYALEDVILACLDIPPVELEFLLDGVQMNMKMAEVGRDLESGLGFGRSWQKLQRLGYVSDDPGNEPPPLS